MERKSYNMWAKLTLYDNRMITWCDRNIIRFLKIIIIFFLFPKNTYYVYKN